MYKAEVELPIDLLFFGGDGSHNFQVVGVSPCGGVLRIAHEDSPTLNNPDVSLLDSTLFVKPKGRHPFFHIFCFGRGYPMRQTRLVSQCQAIRPAEEEFEPPAPPGCAGQILTPETETVFLICFCLVYGASGRFPLVCLSWNGLCPCDSRWSPLGYNNLCMFLAGFL